MSKIYPIILCHTLILVCTLLFPVSAKVPAIIVFGDSTVDTGNNNVLETLLKSNFAPYGRDFEGGRPTGRFCNGRVPPDFISELFGLKKTVPAYLDPNYGISDFATGVVFASAGTGYDNTTTTVFNVMPLWKQIELYKEFQSKLRVFIGEQKADEIIKESVHFLSIGTNDFLANFYVLPATRAKFTVQQFEDRLIQESRQFINTIYDLGARKITISGISPIGCVPLERTVNFMAIGECNEEYNNVALEFNEKLEEMVKEVDEKLFLGQSLIFYSPYDIFEELVRHPSLYGIEVVDEGCCGTGLIELSYLCNVDDESISCPDPDKYLFWDALHPTQNTYRILSQHLFQTLLYKFLH